MSSHRVSMSPTTRFVSWTLTLNYIENTGISLMSRTLHSLLAAVLVGASAVRADDSGKLVTVLTVPEPQTQLMAMALTMLGAEAKRWRLG